MDDQGLHIEVNDKPQILDVDNIILCAGQEPLRDLQQGLEQRSIKTHLIGGADVASQNSMQNGPSGRAQSWPPLSKQLLNRYLCLLLANTEIKRSA